MQTLNFSKSTDLPDKRKSWTYIGFIQKPTSIITNMRLNKKRGKEAEPKLKGGRKKKA